MRGQSLLGREGGQAQTVPCLARDCQSLRNAQAPIKVINPSGQLPDQTARLAPFLFPAQAVRLPVSPHEGEDPLSLVFALIPAVVGVLIALYLLVRIVQASVLSKRVNAQRLDPRAFAEYPELQAMVDRFYLLRYRARELHLSATPPPPERELEARVGELDERIEQGLEAVRKLREAKEPEEIASARQEIARITQQLEGAAQA